MKRIIMSVDLEEDVPPHLEGSFSGVEVGMPRVLNVFERHSIKANVFVTAEVCRMFPGSLKEILELGHEIGNHGLNHELLCRMDFARQHSQIKKSTEIIKDVIGESPTTFRAPCFSADGRTIGALEDLGYNIDSSVLPGRVLRKWRILRIYDFRRAPRSIYHPSRGDICSKGDTTLFEVPVTENPLAGGTPIGLGYLNTFGVERTTRAIEKTTSPYVMFLIHPWEAVDLGKQGQKLPLGLRRSLSPNMSLLEELITGLRKTHIFHTMADLMEGIME